VGQVAVSDQHSANASNLGLVLPTLNLLKGKNLLFPAAEKKQIPHYVRNDNSKLLLLGNYTSLLNENEVCNGPAAHYS
jgi:hypothetical protein